MLNVLCQQFSNLDWQLCIDFPDDENAYDSGVCV